MVENVKTIAVIGASGFVGKVLVAHLLQNTTYRIKAVCRHPESISVDPQYVDRFIATPTNVLHQSQVDAALADVDAAIYLIHMMAHKTDYDVLESKAANIFGKAVVANGVSRVIYLSGLGNKRDKLSKHLKSRHMTGRILRRYSPLVIELRAAMIIGSGSAAYEIMRRLVQTLPFQIMPKWAITNTQPITLHDTILYLARSIDVPIAEHTIVDIGGPTVLTYKDLITQYAAYVGKPARFIVLPYTPLWLASFGLNLFVAKRHARIGRQMSESLTQPMVVINKNAQKYYPEIKPTKYSIAFDE